MKKTVELHSSYVEKTVEIPQCSSSLLKKVIDMPVDMRLQVPHIVQTAQKPVEFAQVQFLGGVCMPATTGAGMVLTAQKTAEPPQLALTFGQGC